MLCYPQRAAWRIENVTPDDMALVRKFHDKKVSDASARAFLWFLRNKQLFQQQLDDDPNVLVVNYDGMVTKPVEMFERMFEFLGVDFRPRYARTVHSRSIRKSASPAIDREIAEMCDEMYVRLCMKAP